MKWAGRVLLIGLIASTLFVAKQNNFSPIAVAQTSQFEIQSCEDILTELNRVAPSNIVEIVRCQRETNRFGDTWNVLVEFSPYTSTRTGPWPSPPEVWQDNACAPNRNVGPSHDYENCFTDTPNRFGKIGQIKNILTFGCPTVVGGGLPALGAWECHTRQESLGNDSYRMFVQTHLVFTIPTCNTGGTGGQGFLVERAHAQECLPDLVPIVDGISIEVTDGQNIKHNIPISQFPAGIGSDIKKVELKNIKIKNIGNAPSTSGFTVRVNPYIEYSTLPWEEGPLHDAVLDGSRIVNTTINPGQTSTTSIVLFDIGWNMSSNRWSWAITKLAKANKSSDYLYIFVDSDKNIHEQNENNNTFKVDNAFNWAVIKATVSSWINNSGLIHPIPITVAFRNINDPEGRYTKYATLGKDSLVAFFAPTESLYSGWKSYVISVYVGGTLAGKSVIELITDYRIYPVTLKISSGILIRFSGKQEQEFSTDGRSHYFPASSGTFTLKSFGTKKQYNYSLKNFSKFIPLGTIPDGEYQVITTNTQYKESWGEYREDPINTKYPEPTRSQSGAYPMMIDIGPRDKNEIYDITTLLGKYCQDLPNPSSLRLCIYDDPETKDKILNDTFPLVKAQVNRLKSFQYGAGGLKKIIFSPDTTHKAAAFYDGNNRDEIVINFSGASPWEPTIAVHETFHLLDDFYRPGYDSIASSDSNFQRSVRSQFSTTTGKWLWDKIIRPANYDHGETGYSSYELIINNGASYKYKEVLAEEMATTCLFQDQLLVKLNSVESIWRQTHYATPPPGNLISQRDNALNRIKGRVKDGNGNYVTIPEIASWFQQCGR